HALGPGAAGRPVRLHASARGVGEIMPEVLVSPLRVWPATGSQPGGRPGFGPGFLRAAFGEALSQRCGSAEGKVPLIPANGAEAVYGQRMGPRASSEAVWRPRGHLLG